MANNYTQYSAMLCGISDEGKAWIDPRLERGVCDCCAGLDENAEPKCSCAKEAFNREKEEDPELIEEDWYFAGNNGITEYCWEKGKDGKNDLWIYAEECGGNLDALGDILRLYFALFDPKGSFGMCWADSCSKPRLDEFGGGAMFVTSAGVHYMSTYEWLRTMEKKHGNAE